MKTIEERAAEYVANAPNRSMYDAYLAGAKEALAGQWRMCEDEMPKEMERVLVGTITRHVFIGFWREEDGWEINTMYPAAFGKAIAWTPIPELPTLKPTEK